MEQAEQELRGLAYLRLGSIEDAAPDNSLKEEIFERLSQYRSRLRLVEPALEGILSGTFGTCADCVVQLGADDCRLCRGPATAFSARSD